MILRTEKLLEDFHALRCQKKTADLKTESWKCLFWQPAYDSKFAVIFSLKMELQFCKDLKSIAAHLKHS